MASPALRDLRRRRGRQAPLEHAGPFSGARQPEATPRHVEALRAATHGGVQLYTNNRKTSETSPSIWKRTNPSKQPSGQRRNTRGPRQALDRTENANTAHQSVRGAAAIGLRGARHTRVSTDLKSAGCAPASRTWRMKRKSDPKHKGSNRRASRNL